MFIGEYYHNIDEKGRLALPVKFRKMLSGGGVVTRGLDRCLFLYPQKIWDKMAIKLANLPINQANARAFTRSMLAGAMEAAVDSQGRILVPEYLRAYAGLAKKVVVAGLYDRLEFWDENAWEKYKKATEKDSERIAEELDFGS